MNQKKTGNRRMRSPTALPDSALTDLHLAAIAKADSHARARRHDARQDAGLPRNSTLPIPKSRNCSTQGDEP